jgi:hypothetical protein
MSGENDSGDAGRQPPSGSAWRDAQKAVSDRNEEARKAGRERRLAHEKKLAALRRAEEARATIYR